MVTLRELLGVLAAHKSQIVRCYTYAADFGCVKIQTWYVICAGLVINRLFLALLTERGAGTLSTVFSNRVVCTAPRASAVF